MNRFVILLLVTMFTTALTVCQSVDSTHAVFPMQAFDEYERERKEVAVGILCSTWIPGGGCFYAGHTETGLLYAAVEVAGGVWLVNADPTSRITPALLLLVVKGFEYGEGISEVQDYNAGIRRSTFNLSLVPTRSGGALSLSYSF